MHPWLTSASARLADAVGADRDDDASLRLAESEVTALLDLARIAAHESGDRTNAPLLSYLVGVAHGRSGRPLQELIAAATATSGQRPHGAGS
jgi:hypothetical protein